MTGIVAFLAAATFNPIFDPKFAPVIVDVANKYFHQPVRLVWELTDDPYSVFASEALKGHHGLVVLQTHPLSSVQEMRRIINGKCDVLLFLAPMTDRRSLRNLSKHRWNPGGRIIVVTRGNSTRSLHIIRSIWTNTKTENVLLVAINDGVLEFYQWTPYRVGECRNVKSVDFIDQWKDGKFAQNASFTGNKALTTLNGCDLLFAANEAYPYVFNNFTAGMEMSIFNLLAESIGFTPRFVPTTRSRNFWNVKTYNGSHWVLSGPFKLLYDQEIDVLFSGVTAQIDRYAASSATFPHAVENVVWTVPAPRVVSPVQNAFRALSPTSWFMIILSLLVGSVAVYVTHDPKCPTYRASFFYTLGTLINGIPSFLTENWRLRVITFGMVILAMHFFIAYQSSLIVLLTTPILEKPFRSVKEMMDENLTCYTYETGGQLLRLHQEENLPRNFKVMKGSIWTYLQEIANDRTGYLLMPESAINFLTWRRFHDKTGRNLLRRLKDPFLVLPISFYLAPGHPLAPLMGKKILRIVECGIADHWSYLTKRVKFAAHDGTVGKKLQPLSDYHLMGAFVLLLFTSTISVFVFLAEIVAGRLYKRAAKKRNLHGRRRLQLIK